MSICISLKSGIRLSLKRTKESRSDITKTLSGLGLAAGSPFFTCFAPQ